MRAWGDPKASLSQPSPAGWASPLVSSCSWTEPLPHPTPAHLGDAEASFLKTNNKQNKISHLLGQTLETKKNKGHA